MLKIALDFVIALLAVILLSPLMLIIAILIKLDDNGAVIFYQQRIGRHGKPFMIYKFRSMYSHNRFIDYNNHDNKQNVAVASKGGCGYCENDSSYITAWQDRRITKIGAILRKYKLDELPQLFNVLKGDMALVGPRPEVPKYVSFYDQNIARLVLSVKPGITSFESIAWFDEAKVLARYDDIEAAYIKYIMPRKLKYASYYAKHHNMLLDLRILCATLQRMFKC